MKRTSQSAKLSPVAPIAASTYVGQADVSPQHSELDQEIHYLSNVAHNLGEKLVELNSRLSPVLSAECKAQVSGELKGAGNPMKCRVSCDVEAVKNQLETMSENVDSLLERLAV